MAAEILKLNSQETETRDLTARFLAEFVSGNPAEVILRLEKSGLLSQILPELAALKGVEQRSDYHLEGDVWQHTLGALKVLDVLLPDASLDLRLAVLLHDIGKPDTFQQGSDWKVNFIGHSQIGAEIAETILIRLSGFDPSTAINKEKIIWLIKNHLVFQGSAGSVPRDSTLDRYYFNAPPGWGNDLLVLAQADTAGRESVNLASKSASLDAVIARIEDLRAKRSREQTPPRPILNGEEIMSLFDLPPSPEVGRIKRALLEIYDRLGFLTKKTGEETAVLLRDRISSGMGMEEAIKEVVKELSSREEDFGQEIITIFVGEGEESIVDKELPKGQWQGFTLERRRARELEGQRLQILIFGPPQAGKTSFVDSLGKALEELKRNLPFKIRIETVDLDQSRLDLSYLKSQEPLGGRKRRWTRSLAQKAQREFSLSVANLVLGDSPGGKPDEITGLIVQVADCAILLVSGSNDVFYQERRKLYKNFLTDHNVPLIAEFRTRPPGQFKDSAVEPIQSELRLFAPGEFIGGQIVGLQFGAENKDPVIEDTAKALLFSILPGLITKE